MTTFLEEGEYDPDIYVGGGFASLTSIISGFHFSRVGRRVDFSGKILLGWTDDGSANLQVPLPLPTNTENCKMCAVVTEEGDGPRSIVNETQVSGSTAPYLFISLTGGPTVTMTTLTIRGTYLIVE